LDYVSIDVEGMELDVLRGFNLKRHTPPLLLIEDHLFHLRTHRHLCQQGYRLVKRTGLNNWYVPVAHPFAMASAGEKVRLFRKVWIGTPWRAMKHHLRAARQGRKG
jgi:hypothetical protein